MATVGELNENINNHFSIIKDYEGKCPPIGKWTSTAWQGFGIPEISSFCSSQSPTCENNDCHKNANCAEGTNSYKCFCKGRAESFLIRLEYCVSRSSLGLKSILKMPGLEPRTSRLSMLSECANHLRYVPADTSALTVLRRKIFRTHCGRCYL